MDGYKLLEDGEMVDFKDGQPINSKKRQGTNIELNTTTNTPVSQNIVKALHAAGANRSGLQLSMGWEHYFNQLDVDDRQLLQQMGKAVSNLSDNDWAFKHTACYWVAICFIFGSIVFTSGSLFWLFDLNYTQEMALVNYPYFAGSITFSVGSYISWWETMNLKDPCPPKTIWFSFKDRNISWWICWWYVVGTTFYYGNTLSGIQAWKLPESWSPFPWWMGFFGGIGFTLGGIFECIAYKFWKWRPYKLGWWVAYVNVTGGTLFAIAAAIGFYYEVSPKYALAAKWAYLIGSIFYLIGGILSLVMWKTEQFGLGFLPELNLTKEKDKRKTVSFIQLPFLIMYCCTSAVSVTGIVYTYCAGHAWYKVSMFILALVIPTGVLCLGSVIHRVPEEPPYSYLLWFLRFVMTWLTVNNLAECLKLHEEDFPKCW